MMAEFVVAHLIHYKDGTIGYQVLHRGEKDACLKVQNASIAIAVRDASKISLAECVIAPADEWDEATMEDPI
jgi:hypothetical protein